MASEWSEWSARKKTQRRANTETLRSLATGGLEHLDEPSFARPTLSLSTKAKVRKRDFSTDALDEDTERQAPSLEARGVIDKVGMDELRAMKSSISEVPLFKECSPKFVEAIAEQVSHRLFTPGQEIMTEGDNGDSMYILHRGEVEVLIGSQRVCTLKDGAVFGEIAALCKNPLLARRTATIRALTLCDCRVTYRESLLKVMTRFKADEEILAKRLEARLVELRKMGKLPHQKEWWRVDVKSDSSRDHDRPSLPAISLPRGRGEKENARLPTLPMKSITDGESPQFVSLLGSLHRGEGEGDTAIPLWALEMACSRSHAGSKAHTKLQGFESSTSRGRSPRTRGPSCMSSLASMKADARDRGELDAIDGPRSARVARSAPVPQIRGMGPFGPHLHDIRSSR
ncbi:Potassium/sodium hyperpolarization-activated cyclic nucleotide-gated channel 2 (Brain cyclic nucleotide-gated channel 2) (BCNG-2) [Durusdinium trenchii]|uniref:Potassium/sodium hyperpolarization-activated cyclic nucleotide-gated channel 2 (Brain cyclic nucleotide-gated channel 2) (BCNG-2) n=1 Tax=Durusdinium trenchii TaxID=1381693 RepID=A0ABP0P7W9_9DINO